MAFEKHEADLVAEYAREEFERLAALAAALEYWVSPQPSGNPDECQNPTAWRLAQVLDDRLSGTAFLKNVDRLLGRA